MPKSLKKLTFITLVALPKWLFSLIFYMVNNNIKVPKVKILWNHLEREMFYNI